MELAPRITPKILDMRNTQHNHSLSFWFASLLLAETGKKERSIVGMRAMQQAEKQT